MDYFTRYGLEFNPFIKNSKDIFIDTKENKEVSVRLDFLLKTKGFGLITGAPGKGKTTMIRNYTTKLNTSLYKVIYVCLTTLSNSNFFKYLVMALGNEPAFNKQNNFHIVQDEITRLAIEKRKIPIFIIDEANSINSSVLYDLKMLFNFDMDSKDRAVILLIGLPKIIQTLNLTSHEPLKQRIIMNYNFEGLTKEESKIYITTKIKEAGCKNDIFDAQSIEAIINAADGTPRLINKYCNNCFLIGNSLGKDIIDSEIAMKAINESELG